MKFCHQNKILTSIMGHNSVINSHKLTSYAGCIKMNYLLICSIKQPAMLVPLSAIRVRGSNVTSAVSPDRE